jgi:tetratricopeptide (TPR) repeat protein
VFQDRARSAWACAATAALLVPGFVWLGDWPMISNAIHPAWYGRPYPAFKHYAHAVWLLHDAELEGNLFSDYSSGNFLGYWLAPRMRTFVNGSLNVPTEVMDARHTIVGRRASESGESFTELLDRYRIDAFFGSGLPRVSRPGRPSISTTTHLERTPGWISAFRNARSAVYLRDNPRNRRNLERLATYYEREHVPFDPRRGFDPGRVLDEAPRWAFEHGLVPVGFQQLQQAARSRDPTRRAAARQRLAELYAMLGLYERALEVDRRLLRANPRSLAAARRQLWSLLHLHRTTEAQEAAQQLAALVESDDGISEWLIEASRRATALSSGLEDPQPEAEVQVQVGQLQDGDAQEVVEKVVIEATADWDAGLLTGLPIFTPSQARRALAGILEPDPRQRRR